MLDVTSLYAEHPNEGDPLRYGQKVAKSGHRVPESGELRKPVVVFNITRNCNLTCEHCYAGSRPGTFPGQLSTATIKDTLDDLVDFGVPAVLFSGGEPMVHADFWEILDYAGDIGLRTTLSTNGTLINEERAQRLSESDLRYVGISLDGMETINDEVRGMEGAFRRSVQGIRNCMARDQKVGLRMTLTQHNVEDLEEIFEFIEEEGIQRVCFYHLAYAGRGKAIQKIDLAPWERRAALLKIFEWTRSMKEKGSAVEVLTVGNFVDNVLLYQLLKQEDPQRAQRVRSRMEWNGGGRNSAGTGVSSIDFYGRVHPNQFWMDRTLGNVKERPFSEIWTDPDNEFLSQLRHREKHLKEPCHSCRFLDICGGGLRVRSDSAGDPWGPDPSCYLTDREREGVA